MSNTHIREFLDLIRNSLISPNVADSNGEPANLVDVVFSVSRSVNAVAKSLDKLAEAILKADRGDKA